MTYAQGRTTRAKRSRLLGSIFARTSHDTSASSDERPELRHQTSTSSKRSNAELKPNGWRGVAVRHARETLAERICGRFFARSVSSGITTSTEAPDPEFITVGERLQALSGHADTASVGQQNVGQQNVGQQNLAAILDASARTVAAAVPGDPDRDAPAEARLTAKAA